VVPEENARSERRAAVLRVKHLFDPAFPLEVKARDDHQSEDAVLLVVLGGLELQSERLVDAAAADSRATKVKFPVPLDLDKISGLQFVASTGVDCALPPPPAFDSVLWHVRRS
jgi:hypothetical protein